MQVRCIKAFGLAKPGEIVNGLPDRAMVDPEHWEIVADAEPPDAPVPAPPAPAAVTPASAVIPKEGM